MLNCERIFMTRVGKDVECDVFFPAFDEVQFKIVHMSQTRSHGDLPYDFVIYQRPCSTSAMARSSAAVTAVGGIGQFLHEEYQYLELIREIMGKGVSMGDR